MGLQPTIAPCDACHGEAAEPKGAGRERHGHGMQYAALPYDLSDGLRILLVTSRDTGRWVIPKGWPMARKKAHAAAAREALEEAGVTGRIHKTPVGAYRYIKRLKNGAGLACTVKVYPLEVVRQLKRWPEQGQRTAHWFEPAEAAHAVHEPDLAALIEDFAASPPKPRKSRFKGKGNGGSGLMPRKRDQRR